MNLDWRNPDFSFLVVDLLSSSESFRASLLLLMRKKFLIRCETWPSLPLTDLLVDSGLPEKVRFSVMLVWLGVEGFKSCVIPVAQSRWQSAASYFTICRDAKLREQSRWLTFTLLYGPVNGPWHFG
jgi:hypothetical protein